MEQNTLENIDDSMEYYCRVCTTNTKGKGKFKPDEGIGIFKNKGLKSIMEKYLQLQISENDLLPKVICRECFEKIEAIEFLCVIARRTETLLKDYLKNKQNQKLRFQNEFNTFAICQNAPHIKNKQDEVVVNVSVSNPLTKDINNKLLVAQRKKGSLDKAFTPTQLNRAGATSTPNPIPPTTIVHQMPRKKLPLAPHLLEKKKKLQLALTNATTVTLENPPTVMEPTAIKLPTRPKVVAPQPAPLRHISEAPIMPQKIEIHPVITGNTPTLGQGVPLGSIIKDEDLLKLILKALKWPFNKLTLGIQIQRLKDTNFSDVIVDPHLLQDADLIQILGPLINPNIVPTPVAPPPQTYHITIPPENVAVPQATISYKLPAETSVQIITVPLEERVSQDKPVHRPSTSNSRTVVRKRKRYNTMLQKPTSNAVIVVSDDSEDEAVKELTAQEKPQRFEVQLDPAMYPGIGESSNSNEIMLATLNRQREAMMRMHRSKRKQSLVGKNVEMVDDIMIVDEGIQMIESYPEVVLLKKPRKSNQTAATPSTSTAANSVIIAEQKINPKPPQIPPPPPPLLPRSSVKPNVEPVRKPIYPTTITKTPIPPAPRTEDPLPPSVAASNDMPAPSKPSPVPAQYKNTTLADADSTTKIVIQESKVVKPPSSSLDLEDKIVKVRIGKQKTTENVAAEEDDESTRKSSSDEDVLVIVEYDDDDKNEIGETEESNENKPMEELSTPESKQADDVVPSPPPLPPSTDTQNTSSGIELPAIEIKEEEQVHETGVVKPEEVVEIKEEQKSVDFEEKADEDEEESNTSLNKSEPRSFIASRTAKAKPVQIRISQRRKAPSSVLRNAQVKTDVSTSRPARKSKTLSKYYKGPPSTTATSRSMRSRT